MPSAQSTRTLVIVESPGKVEKLKEYLGPDYEVKASAGHIRDLPSRRNQIPSSIANEPWASLGVNPETFRPYYVVDPDKLTLVKGLKTAHNRCRNTLLAMDQDREGESIAWHLAQELRIRDPQRIVFTEITRTAIQKAVQQPRPINLKLVAAQESRRIIDRLVGYGASQLLWNAVAPHLSAGRVQSATLMILMQREMSRMVFVPATYYTLKADSESTPAFVASVTHIRTRSTTGDQALAKSANFDIRGQALPADNVIHLTAEQARAVAQAIDGRPATVTQVTRSETRHRPSPPFVTSTLQQAGEKLGMSIKDVMSAAQALYEGGYITYMRTDSVALSDEALHAARSEVVRLFGPTAVPEQPRRYATHDKNAQEAHEAIRPTGHVFRPPDITGLSGNELRLYDAVYRRTLASQMHDTVYDTTVLTLRSGPATLSTSGRVLKSQGHTLLTGLPKQDAEDAPQGLPDLNEGETVTLHARAPETASTTVPPRYSPGDLIDAMKRVGIGRPSTYESTLATLARREYTVQDGRTLAVTAIGLLVGTYLARHVDRLIAREYTARMETELDQIAGGDLTRLQYLTRAWTEELGPAINRAEPTSPVLNLPHLPGVSVYARQGRVMLSQEGHETEIPPFLVPTDLTPADVQAITEGRFTFPQRGAAPKGGKSGSTKRRTSSGSGKSGTKRTSAKSGSTRPNETGARRGTRKKTSG